MSPSPKQQKKTHKQAKVKRVKAWMCLSEKGEISGCVPHVFDEKYKLAMILRNSGLFSTFELKKFANMYKKTLLKNGSKVVPCTIVYKLT